MTEQRLLSVAGLDLGTAQDFTALAVPERAWRAPEALGPGVDHYAVRHLERFAPGALDAEVCAWLAALYAGPPLAGTPLAADQTGVRSLLATHPLSAAPHRHPSAEQGGWHSAARSCNRGGACRGRRSVY